MQKKRGGKNWHSRQSQEKACKGYIPRVLMLKADLAKKCIKYMKYKMDKQKDGVKSITDQICMEGED